MRQTMVVKLLACSIILFSLQRIVDAQCTYEWAPTPASGFDGAIKALVQHGGALYAGGDFTTAGSASSMGIARFDGNQWSSVGGGVDGEVLALISFGDSLIAGGRFGSAGEVISQAVARWDGLQWHPLPEGFYYVDELAVVGDQLFASGEWLIPGRPEVVARLGTDEWEVLGDYEFGWVSDISVCGDSLCVASHNEVSTWNGAAWNPVGQFESNVYALGNFDGKFIAATTVQAQDDYAALVLSWESGKWVPLGSPMAGYNVGDLTCYNGMLVASGAFFVADWDGKTWNMLPEAADFGYVYSVLPVGRVLLMGGDFFTLPLEQAWYLSSWSPDSLFGDADGNQQIDLADAVIWSTCVSGPASPDSSAVTTAECLCVFNSDGDADVDLRDFAAFQNSIMP